MPLLQSQATLAASQIIDYIINARSHYTAAASHLNNMTSTIIGLSNDNLAALGNNLGPAEMESLTTAHKQQGEALNSLIQGINTILTESGISSSGVIVDVRPLSEKLAAQRREIVLTDGVFQVLDFPPEIIPIVEEPVIEEPIVEELVVEEPV